MKWAFLISGLLELVGGLICYFNPNLIFEGHTLYLSRLYAISALVLGIISLSLYFNYEDSKRVKAIFLALMFFHGAVAMITYGTSDGITYQSEATITHLAVFVVFFIGYMKDLKPDKK